jgi:carboxypeptidase family protein
MCLTPRGTAPTLVRMRSLRVYLGCWAGIGALALTLPNAVRGQTPAPTDTGRLVLIVARAQQQSSRDTVVKIEGARVALKSGALLGTTDDSGSFHAAGLPMGRVEFTFRAKDYAPLTCRLNVRAEADDTVRVNMQLERKVVVWSSPGCKQHR